MNDPELRARSSATGGRRRVLDRFTWRKTAEGTAEQYYLELEAHARRRFDAGIALTCSPSTSTARARAAASACSTSAAGGGRHAFEAMRRGARVTALDYSAADLKDVRRGRAARCSTAARSPTTVSGPASSTATRSICRSRRHASTASIVSEVLEHIWDDERAIAEIVRVLRPGGRMAATVPTRWPERVSWALNYHYHDTPGGHVRIYRQHELEQKLERAGLFLRGSHHAHAFHSPYWWLKCAFGLDNTDAAPVQALPRLPRGTSSNATRVGRRVTERALNPVLGKSLVVYSEKVPGDGQMGKAQP